MTLKRAIAAICLCGLAACSNPKFEGRPNLGVVVNERLPIPLPDKSLPPAPPYLMGSSDKLQIDVFGLPELSVKEAIIDLNGDVSVPLAGTFHAAGLTPPQLAAAVEGRLRTRYVRDPHVAVNVTELVSQNFTVEGEVHTPGVYAVDGRMTLLKALARASGTTEYTRDDQVVVFRTVGDKDYAALYDLRAIRVGAYKDPEIYANDVVVVDRARAREVFRNLTTVASLVSGPIILLLTRI